MARSLPSIAAPENSFRQRLGDAPEAKARLAEAAFAMLAPGETVFLDASSTTYYVARLIALRGLAVRVITNSLPVLHELSGAEQVDSEVVAIGGTFRRLTCSYVGPAAVRSVRDHFADRRFLSVTGITVNGVLTDADVLEAEVKRAMLEQSEQSILMVDDSKLRGARPPGAGQGLAGLARAGRRARPGGRTAPHRARRDGPRHLDLGGP